jgi:hypothetical protein
VRSGENEEEGKKEGCCHECPAKGEHCGVGCSFVLWGRVSRFVEGKVSRLGIRRNRCRENLKGKNRKDVTSGHAARLAV